MFFGYEDFISRNTFNRWKDFYYFIIYFWGNNSTCIFWMEQVLNPAEVSSQEYDSMRDLFTPLGRSSDIPI